MCRLREPLVTKFALKRFVSCMASNMDIERSLPHEFFTAIFTNKDFFLRMHPYSESILGQVMEDQVKHYKFIHFLADELGLENKGQLFP